MVDVHCQQSQGVKFQNFIANIADQFLTKLIGRILVLKRFIKINIEK